MQDQKSWRIHLCCYVELIDSIPVRSQVWSSFHEDPGSWRRNDDCRFRSLRDVVCLAEGRRVVVCRVRGMYTSGA